MDKQSSEPTYDVVWPLGHEVQEELTFGDRLADLNGKTIAELQDVPDGRWFPVLREELKRRYPGLKIVDYETFGLTHGPDERQVVAELPAKLKEFGVDAVISGVGL